MTIQLVQSAQRKPKSVHFYNGFFAELNNIRQENMREHIQLTPQDMATIVELLADYQCLELKAKAAAFR